MTRAVIYCRCSTEEECQKDALIRQAAEARECVRRLNWSLEDEYIESRSGTSTRGREQYQRLFSCKINSFELWSCTEVWRNVPYAFFLQ